MTILFWCAIAALFITLGHAVNYVISFGQGILIFLAAYIFANLMFMLFWLIVSWCVDRSEPVKKVSRFCQHGCMTVTSFICAHSNVHAKVIGQEKLPKDQRFLYISNHRSRFDPLTASSELGKYDIMFISKPSNLRIPLVGPVAHRAGYLAIDHENDRNALRTILTAADYIKKDWCSMGIYPEGTRSKTGELGNFHAGSFKIAQKANCPIVIVATQGTELVARNAPLRPTHVTLTILEVIPPEKVKAMSTKELAEYSRNLILAELSKWNTKRSPT